MKVLTAAALATIALSPAPALASFQSNCYPAWNNVSTLPPQLKGFCEGYLTGFEHALEADGKICIIGNAPPIARLNAIVSRWMANHPGMLSQPTPAIVKDAFGHAFPCRY